MKNHIKILGIAIMFIIAIGSLYYYSKEKEVEKTKESNSQIKNLEQVIKELENDIKSKENQIKSKENELKLVKNTGTFSDLFVNSFKGTYTINHKMGGISLKFKDKFSGVLSYSVDYKTIEKIEDSKSIKINNPYFHYKIVEMQEDDDFITIEGYELIQPTLEKNKEGKKEEIPAEFKIVGTEMEPQLFKLRMWYVNNSLVGDIVDTNDKVIGNFKMQLYIDESTKNTENPK